MIFQPNFKCVGNTNPNATIEEFSKETGVYSATPEFVRENCGVIANRILDAVPPDYITRARESGLYPNIDVRVHRLYPGDYPAFPGWHCDGLYRETYFSQPDPERTQVANHIICTVSTGNVCTPEFLDAGLDWEPPNPPDSDHTLWGQLNAELEASGPHPTWCTRDGMLVGFDSWTIHRVRPAKVRGWRLFFRIAQWYRPNLEHGKIVRQEQIYRELGGGW